MGVDCSLPYQRDHNIVGVEVEHSALGPRT